MIARIKKAISHTVTRAIAPWTRPFLGGVGAILMLHRLVDPPRRPRAGWVGGIENDLETLREILYRVRRRGYEFVSIDQFHKRLVCGKPQRKCFAITFDDGYRDIYDRALPLFEKEDVPFTVYVTTGFPDRTLVPWPQLADEFLQQAPSVSLTLHGQTRVFDTRSLAARNKAFNTLAALFDSCTTPEAHALANEAFGQAHVQQVTEEMYLSWNHVLAMAQHPLVTLGAHTVHHPSLKRLSAPEAHREMAESKRILEARIGRLVDHFAYPYGFLEHAGPREFVLAEACGFKTAVTTRKANVMRAHAHHLYALPRVYGQTAEEVDLAMSGARTLLLHRKVTVIDH